MRCLTLLLLLSLSPLIRAEIFVCVDPATGEKIFYGEFLINAQGEDVVAGVRTPEPVVQLKSHMPKA